MSDVTVGAMVRVKKSLIDLDAAVNGCHCANKARTSMEAFGRKPGAALDVQLSWEDEEFIYLPRGYHIPFLEQPFTGSVSYDLPDYERAEFPQFLRTLRPSQRGAWEAITPEDSDDRLLVLGCGRGKTTLALALAGFLCKRTLIIVDLDFIADQWVREIGACYGIPPKDIGRIQGSKATIGKHFTVALAKTLSLKDFDEKFYDQWGLSVFDEVHVAAAPTYTGILGRIRGQRLGLSATPDRRDGLDPVFRYHLGGLTPCYVDISRDRSSTWAFKQLPRLVSSQAEASCYVPLRGKFKKGGKQAMMLLRPRFESFAAESEHWDAIILRDLAKAVAAGRNVLLLGGRTEQLFRLCEKAKALRISCGVAVGSVSKKEREEAFKKQVLLATWQLASKALDIDRLDTLVLLFPSADQGFLRQAIGRIDREKAGKKAPLAVVYDHGYSRSLKRKGDEMRTAVLELDPGAEIRTVKVAWARSKVC